MRPLIRPDGLFIQAYTARGEFLGTWFFMKINSLKSSEIRRNPQKAENQKLVSPHSSSDLRIFCNLGASISR
jgi:hypothetical protein